RLDNVTSKITLYRNIGFNESKKYKKTFIGSGVVAYEVISEWKAGLKDDMDARLDVYVLSNDDMVFSYGCKSEIWATKGLLDKANKNILGSLKANVHQMEALSTTKAGYMTFTKAWKKAIWLKRLLTESRYELRLVVGINTGAWVKGSSWYEVPA
nr:hypothetical protein [Tanacetum cinerariifolium]